MGLLFMRSYTEVNLELSGTRRGIPELFNLLGYHFYSKNGI